mgnify:CR=1 FL=1
MLSVGRRKKRSSIIGSYPEKVILKNKFYPKGLTENQIYNYYISQKTSILSQVKNRELMFFLQLEDEQIVKRKDSKGKYLKLTPNNYEQLIHGRVLSIHGTMRKNEEFGIVDIDSDNFRRSRRTTAKIYDYLKQSSKIKKIVIRYTGKDSFHLICYFRNKKHIDNIRILLKKFLIHKKSKQIDVSFSRSPGKTNLDLSPNKFRGGFILSNALSVMGLRCLEVSRGELMNFQKSHAIIG